MIGRPALYKQASDNAQSLQKKRPDLGGFDAECSLLTGEAVSKYNEDLECAGFCPVAMVAGDGTLIPGVEAMGIVAYRLVRHLSSFTDNNLESDFCWHSRLV